MAAPKRKRSCHKNYGRKMCACRYPAGTPKRKGASKAPGGEFARCR